MIETKEQYDALTKHIRHRMAPDYQDQLWELIEALREVARACNSIMVFSEPGMGKMNLATALGDAERRLDDLPDWMDIGVRDGSSATSDTKRGLSFEEQVVLQD